MCGLEGYVFTVVLRCYLHTDYFIQQTDDLLSLSQLNTKNVCLLLPIERKMLNIVIDTVLKCGVFKNGFQLLSDEYKVDEIGGEEDIDKKWKKDMWETIGSRRGGVERGSG